MKRKLIQKFSIILYCWAKNHTSTQATFLTKKISRNDLSGSKSTEKNRNDVSKKHQLTTHNLQGGFESLLENLKKKLFYDESAWLINVDRKVDSILAGISLNSSSIAENAYFISYIFFLENPTSPRWKSN